MASRYKLLFRYQIEQNLCLGTQWAWTEGITANVHSQGKLQALQVGLPFKLEHWGGPSCSTYLRPACMGLAASPQCGRLHGHCCAGVWGGSPPALPWLAPRQPAPDHRVLRVTAWGHGLAARVRHVGPCKGRLRTCSCSQHPVTNLDFHVFPPNSGNVLHRRQQLWIPSVGGTGCWLPGAGSCLAEYPQAAMWVGQCHLLLGSPGGKHPPAQLFCWLRGTACQGLQADSAIA